MVYRVFITLDNLLAYRSISDLKFLFLDEGEMLEGLPAEELIWIDEAGGLWDANGVLPSHTNYDSSCEKVLELEGCDG